MGEITISFTNMPHLLVDISAHGYGHVSQTAPVLNALERMMPALRFTIRSAAPEHLLRQRIHGEFTHIPTSFDFGMAMKNAVDVDVEQSAQNYLDFHAEWNEKVEREARVMRELSPDLLLANVPYLSLAAAHAAGVRSVAMCSLNWADIYGHYCVRDEKSQQIHQQMVESYNTALCFLQPQPSMPMPNFLRSRVIAPIANAGQNQRALMNGHIANGDKEKWVLVGMGGMEFRVPIENWPRIAGVRWLVPAAWGITREDVTAFELFRLSFSDVLASCDAVLTKPGYGTFAEAAGAGVPVLYVTRNDWPEEPCLVSWIQQHGVAIKVEREELHAGRLQNKLSQLWRSMRPPTPVLSGPEEAAHYLHGLLG